MAASGFAALGYQIVWTQQAGTWLGHEGMAALAVVAAFFGGLALGAAALGRRIERRAQPARWYAGCEALIALWSLLLAVGIAPAGQMLASLIGEAPSPAWHWAVAFGGCFLLLLPATAAMGATLPAMERVTAAWRAQGAADIPALYAANTAGAVLGVLAVAFWLVPELGLTRTSFVCAALNGLCAWGAWRLPTSGAAPEAARTEAGGRGRVAARLAATGLLGIGYEVLALRVLSQVCENTVYTFAWLLAVYLVGTALGAAAHARWGARGAVTTERLLAGLAVAVLIGTGTLWGAEAQRAFVAHALGGGFAGEVLAEATLAATAFGLPTLVMGALFSQLCLQARAAGMAFSAALALNTAAAAFAPLLFGVWLLPALGPKAALLLVAVGYLALLRWPAWRQPWALLPAGAAAAAALLAPPLQFVQVPEGGRVLSHLEGPGAAVSVVEDAAGVAVLRINNRQQEGSSATVLADGRQAVLPLLLHTHPQRVLFLGLGTGVTATSAAVFDPALQVDAVELLPEVIKASALFAGALGDEAARARVHLHAADARRYARRPGPAYDVIVADNFHPARSGSAALYTVEHFRAVRERLAPDGLFCQWLPLHQLDRATLQSIVRSYQAAFPQARALLATLSLQTPTLGLVARRDGAPFAPAATLPPRAADWGIDGALELFGSFVASPEALQRFAERAPLNTDDRPVVSQLAPRITYAPDSTPAQRLLELTHELSVTPAGIGGPALSDAPRLAAYLQARNRFLEAGLQVRPSADVRRMLAQVREPLLAVLRISPEFSPARRPLLQMAQALQALDPAAAAALQEQVERLATR